MANFWMLDLVSNSTQLLLIFLVTFLVPYLILRWLQERKYPPGPTGLPFLGYLPFLTEEPSKKLWEISKKYGKVMSISFGPTKAIIITDYKTAKEVLAHPSALARPKIAAELLPGNGGFATLNGDEWTEQRRFVMHTMRDLGLGRGVWENVTQEYAEEFVSLLKSRKGEPFYYKDYLALSQASNILALLIGRHLPMDLSHPEAQKLLKINDAIILAFESSGISFIAPSLIKYLVFLRISKYYTFYKIFGEFEDFVKKEIEDRLEKNDVETSNDFIGHYLQQIEKLQKVEKVHFFNVDSLMGNVLNLFSGGTDTTTNSLYWLLLLMSKHTDVQKKVQEEIDNVVGRDKRVYWDERNKLPYTMAAIMEMERWVSITPLMPPRCVTETFELGGYTFPKGSMIICNGWAIMRDPKYFKDPHSYKPEHFLAGDGNALAKPESYLAFSFGKRNCPGETVAMMSIFIYFVSIMQKFTVKTSDGKPVNFEMTFSTTMGPKYPQKLRFIER